MIDLYSDTSKSKHNFLREAYYKSLIDLALAKTLFGANKVQSAVFLFQKVELLARRGGFADLYYESSQFLAMNEVFNERYPAQTQKYLDRIDSSLELYTLEAKTGLYLGELRVLYFKKKGKRAYMLAKYEEYYMEVQPYLFKVNSMRFHGSSALIIAYLYFELNGLYQQAVDCLQKGILYFEEMRWTNNLLVATFYTNMIEAGLRTGLYSQCEKWLVEAEGYYIVGSSRWFSSYEHSFRLSLLRNDMANAHEIISKIRLCSI